MTARNAAAEGQQLQRSFLHVQAVHVTHCVFEELLVSPRTLLNALSLQCLHVQVVYNGVILQGVTSRQDAGLRIRTLDCLHIRNQITVQVSDQVAALRWLKLHPALLMLQHTAAQLSPRGRLNLMNAKNVITRSSYVNLVAQAVSQPTLQTPANWSR
jgi:hypothetical protein